MARRLATAYAALLAGVLACSTVTGPTPTVEPPAATVTSTPTPRPTPTKRPTTTPNFAATQTARDFDALLEQLHADGYIDTTEGRVYEVESVEKRLAERDWFFWPEDDIGPNFVFHGHFSWSTATSALGFSGCGVAFGIKDLNVDSYTLFLDDTRMEMGAYEGDDFDVVKAASGKERFDFPNPAEADFTLAVRGPRAYVFVDNEVTTYRLKDSHDGSGAFMLAMTSATTQGYGTMCSISEASLWEAR